jgi:hypothetical protein
VMMFMLCSSREIDAWTRGEPETPLNPLAGRLRHLPVMNR